MAKRHANDRNEMFIAGKKAKEDPGIFITDKGLEIHLKEKPDLVFIQQAISSVDYPPRPTYTVKVGSREREYPLDEVVIAQTEDPAEKKRLQRAWSNYLTDANEAGMEQTKRATGAMFYEGTVAQEDFYDPKWERRMKISGWPIPEDPEERWVVYLQTSLSEPEIKRLSAKVVMRSGGVSEEKIAAAVEMFRDSLQDGGGRSDDVVDAGGDSETDRSGEVEP